MVFDTLSINVFECLYTPVSWRIKPHLFPPFCFHLLIPELPLPSSYHHCKPLRNSISPHAFVYLSILPISAVPGAFLFLTGLGLGRSSAWLTGGELAVQMGVSNRFPQGYHRYFCHLFSRLQDQPRSLVLIIPHFCIVFSLFLSLVNPCGANQCIEVPGPLLFSLLLDLQWVVSGPGLLEEGWLSLTKMQDFRIRL